jgi:hypothetical protein
MPNHRDAADISTTADKPKFMRALFMWLQQIAADSSLPEGASRLAICLAGYVNQRSRDAWPTQETLATELSVNIRTVRRTITEMDERGHLEVVSRGWHRSNSYRPIWKDRTVVPGLDTTRPDTSARSAALKTGHLTTQDRTVGDTRPDNWRHSDRALAPSRTIDRTIERTTEGTIDSAHACESGHPDRDLLGDRHQSKPSIRKRSTTTHKRSTPKDDPEGFEEFYRVYPRHASRPAAVKAYRRIIIQGEATHSELLNGAMRYAAERTGEPERFTKHPATWLNGQCWNDAPAASAARFKTNVEKIMEQCRLASGSDDEEIDQ